jgi:hypothetical protein
MGQRHTVSVEDRAEICKALKHMGLSPHDVPYPTRKDPLDDHKLTDAQLIARYANPDPRYDYVDMSKQLVEIEELSPEWSDSPELLKLLARIHTLVTSRAYTPAIAGRVMLLCIQSKLKIILVSGFGSKRGAKLTATLALIMNKYNHDTHPKRKHH